MHPCAELEELLPEHDRLVLRFADDVLFRRFRAMEPQLVSHVDGMAEPPKLQILAISVDGKPAAITSFVVETNAYRHALNNLFARIDLVVSCPQHRGEGLGRAILLSTLAQIGSVYGGRLYSISCLAAHPAIEVMLEQLGFSGSVREGQNFKHEELRLDSGWDQERGEQTLELLGEALDETKSRLARREAA